MKGLQRCGLFCFQAWVLVSDPMIYRPALLHSNENPVMIKIQPPGTLMSSAVYTATVLTSARMAAGMTSRARRPLNRHSAG
ncbi:hypothetical protein DWU98_02400 [Dyella monticola]|uniref:Uncharacterized protein n=1 Tax=Dyella monticola TaxID=1927958 RepID=A0A370X974_9GAMM|nr:hypothetical protein DWU98_02400 [Dyella monticola]